MSQPARKPTNLSLDSGLLSQARALKVNLSRAAEEGVRAAVAEAQAAQWQADNAAALESSNAFVVQSGIPLSRFRQF